MCRFFFLVGNEKDKYINDKRYYLYHTLGHTWQNKSKAIQSKWLMKINVTKVITLKPQKWPKKDNHDSKHNEGNRVSSKEYPICISLDGSNRDVKRRVIFVKNKKTLNFLNVVHAYEVYAKIEFVTRLVIMYSSNKKPTNLPYTILLLVYTKCVKMESLQCLQTVISQKHKIIGWVNAHKNVSCMLLIGKKDQIQELLHFSNSHQKKKKRIF